MLLTPLDDFINLHIQNSRSISFMILNKYDVMSLACGIENLRAELPDARSSMRNNTTRYCSAGPSIQMACSPGRKQQAAWQGKPKSIQHCPARRTLSISLTAADFEKGSRPKTCIYLRSEPLQNHQHQPPPITTHRLPIEQNPSTWRPQRRAHAAPVRW